MGKVLMAAVLILVSAPVNAEIRLWVSTGMTDGDIGGRAGADAFCDGDANKPVIAGSTTRAYISVDAEDEIQDMAANYAIPTDEPIGNQDDTAQIAANFAALLDPDTTPLMSPILASPGSRAVYTGSTRSGSLSFFNCSGWTTNTDELSGQTGDSGATDLIYITGGATLCINARSVFCITYTAPQVEEDDSVCLPIKLSNDKVATVCL